MDDGRAVAAAAPPCAELSATHGEPLSGTAVEARGWLVVEHDGPWSPRAPTAAELGGAVEVLDALPDVRVQLARPVRLAGDPDAVARRHGRGRDAPRQVLLANVAADPARRWAARLTVPTTAALADLDPASALAPRPPAGATPVDGDVWLVCTHGRRDACCARWGRPAALALALAGHEVLETTHSGGHRFAGTAVVLPTGLQFGRLDATSAPRVAEAHARGVVDHDQLRGRCALPRAAQAAELALRRRVDARGLDDVRVVAHEVVASGTTRVELRHGGRDWVLEVVARPAGVLRSVSDGAEPTDPGALDVRTLGPTGA